MIVEIDGNPVEVLNTVKVIWPDPESGQELHLTLNEEGIVWDVVENGEVEHTSHSIITDIYDNLTDTQSQ